MDLYRFVTGSCINKLYDVMRATVTPPPNLNYILTKTRIIKIDPKHNPLTRHSKKGEITVPL